MVFIDVVSFLLLQLHFVHLRQLSIEALLRANFGERIVNVILTLELLVESIRVVLDSLVVAVCFISSVCIHVCQMLHPVCSFLVAPLLERCSSVKPILLVSDEACIRVLGPTVVIVVPLLNQCLHFVHVIFVCSVCLVVLVFVLFESPFQVLRPHRINFAEFVTSVFGLLLHKIIVVLFALSILSVI